MVEATLLIVGGAGAGAVAGLLTILIFELRKQRHETRRYLDNVLAQAHRDAEARAQGVRPTGRPHHHLRAIRD